MTEIWKPVVGFEGYYEVSSLGRVRSVERLLVDKIGRRYVWPSVVLSPSKAVRTGHLWLYLSKNNRRERFFVHRLVAMAFIPNTDNLPFINHKDENSQNNRVDNLEWCTNKYNVNYGTALVRMAQKNMIPVIGTDKDGNEYRFASIKEAGEKTGACRKDIAHCCRKLPYRQTAGGYRWRYAEKNELV